MGHLFAIERLARVARAEQRETLRHPKHGPNSP
jgi:hypothetical protein